MVKFKHFIITQFNLRLWNKDKKNLPTATSEWLAKRFILFDKYCYPSFKNQTDKEFTWICLFDKYTPDPYKEKIEEYRRQCPQLLPCFLDEKETENWLDYTKEIIRSRLEKEDEYIVTTNVDNDDAIHTGMVETVRSLVQDNPREVLYSFNYGYQYFTDLKIILKMCYPHNHFLSLVEKNTYSFNTIKSIPHAKARKKYATVDIKDEPFWIEFVHKNNVNNDLRITSRIKYYPVFRSLSLRKFGIDKALPAKTTITHTILNLPGLFLKTAAVRLSRKIKKKKK